MKFNLFFLKFANFRKKRALLKYGAALNFLQKSYFACYLKENYSSEREFFELRIQHAHAHLFQSMKNLRKCAEFKMDLLERLYEMTCSFGNLRLRVSDRAIFKICEKEFLLMTWSLSDILKKILKLLSLKQATLLQAIDHLDDVTHALTNLWHNTLRITASEPLIFLFFIQDLTDWKNVFMELLKEFERGVVF